MFSGLPPNSDIVRWSRHFAFVPIADIGLFNSPRQQLRVQIISVASVVLLHLWPGWPSTIAFHNRINYLSEDSFKRDVMSDMKTAIMDAAERRIQLGGFGGFSFREVAADVGIKSASVHYHFPTKDDLGAAVLQRWSEHTSEVVDEELKKDPDPVKAWTKAFRGTAHSDARMCPCTVLGAASQDLPVRVAKEVKNFFKMCQKKMIAQGVSPAGAANLLSTITGALVVANALRDTAEYDRATRELVRHRKH